MEISKYRMLKKKGLIKPIIERDAVYFKLTRFDPDIGEQRVEKISFDRNGLITRRDMLLNEAETIDEIISDMDMAKQKK